MSAAGARWWAEDPRTAAGPAGACSSRAAVSPCRGRPHGHPRRRASAPAGQAREFVVLWPRQQVWPRPCCWWALTPAWRTDHAGGTGWLTVRHRRGVPHGQPRGARRRLARAGRACLGILDARRPAGFRCAPDGRRQECVQVLCACCSSAAMHRVTDSTGARHCRWARRANIRACAPSSMPVHAYVAGHAARACAPVHIRACAHTRARARTHIRTHAQTARVNLDL